MNVIFFDENRNIRNSTFRIVAWLTREESNIDTARYSDLLCMPNSNKINHIVSKHFSPSIPYMQTIYNPDDFQQLHCSFLQFQQARTHAPPTNKFAFRKWVFSSARGTELIYVKGFIYIIQSKILPALGNIHFQNADLIVGGA